MKTSYLLAIASLLITVQFSSQAFAVKPVKPPPPPITAEDVVCDGCVDTTDISDGAVTTEKLSTDINDLLSTITQLQARIDALELQEPSPVTKVYAGNILLGHAVAGSGDYNNIGGHFFLHDLNSGYFFWFKNSTSDGIMTLSFDQRDIKYESFDCTGQGYAPIGIVSDTRNVLIGNSNVLYRSLGSYSGIRPVNLNSVRVAETGACFQQTDSIHNDSLALVETIDNPLSFELPMNVEAVSLRLEYAAP